MILSIVDAPMVVTIESEGLDCNSTGQNVKQINVTQKREVRTHVELVVELLTRLDRNSRPRRRITFDSALRDWRGGRKKRSHGVISALTMPRSSGSQVSCRYCS